MKLNNFWIKEPLWQASGEGQPGGDPVPPVDPGPDLSFVPTDFHVDGKPDLAKFAEHYQGLTAAEKARAEAATAVPENYDFALPADLKFEGLDLPEGFKFELKPEDPEFKPLFDELGGLLKSIGAPADLASKATAMIAKYEAAKFAKGYAAQKEQDAAVATELAALGTPAQQEARLGTVQRLLKSKLPADQAKALAGITTSAKALMALEKLLHASGTNPVTVPPTPSVEADLKSYYAQPTK